MFTNPFASARRVLAALGYAGVIQRTWADFWKMVGLVVFVFGIAHAGLASVEALGVFSPGEQANFVQALAACTAFLLAFATLLFAASLTASALLFFSARTICRFSSRVRQHAAKFSSAFTRSEQRPPIPLPF